MLDQFKTFARYNRWANQRLYEACGRLDDAAYYADCKAFFGSIHNTLNHLLLGDRIWFGRIVGEPFAVTGLDQILYPDRHDLARAREEEDQRMIATVDAIAPSRLDQDLIYKTTTGEAQCSKLSLVLSHLFNHETHHRGQVHGMLSQAGEKPPALDLMYFIREG